MARRAPLGMDDVARMAEFWQTTSPVYAHIEYRKHLHSEAFTTRRWRLSWLDSWARGDWLRGKTVGDYGIGAGLLGKVLCANYSIGRYVGIDIAPRQIAAAARLLSAVPGCRHDLVLQSGPPDFRALGLDALVSQQVIQHFPSQRYLDGWLDAVVRARVPKVFLELRYSPVPRFSNWTARPEAIRSRSTCCPRAVTLGVRINCAYVARRMQSYALAAEWITFVQPSKVNTSFQGCSLVLRE